MSSLDKIWEEKRRFFEEPCYLNIEPDEIPKRSVPEEAKEKTYSQLLPA